MEHFVDRFYNFYLLSMELRLWNLFASAKSTSRTEDVLIRMRQRCILVIIYDD